MSEVKHHIGLEVADHCFRLVEINMQDRQSTVLRADVWETEHNFASPLIHEVPFQKDLARSFIASLSDLLNSGVVFSSEVSLVLPVDLPVIATIPVDRRLTAEERHEQLQWEARTLAGLPAGTEMHALTHAIGRSADVEQMLTVALPQSTVDFLISAFSYLTLDLTSVDVDHFIMEDWTKHAHGQEAQSRYAVVGLFERFCTAGAYEGDAYRGFRMRGFDRSSRPFDEVREATARLFEPGAEPPDAVFAFGPDLRPGMADALSETIGAPVSRIMPLVDTAMSDELRTTLALHGEHSFDAAAGAALRGSR